MAEVSQVVQGLWDLDDDILAAELGSRAQAISDDVAGRGARGADPASLDSIDLDVAARAPIDPNFLQVGQRLFARINPMAHELLCKPLGGDDPEAQQVLDEVVNKNYTKAAGMLAPMLITGLGLAPAIGAMLATLIIKKVSNMTSTAICDTWEKTLATSQTEQ